MFNNNEDRNSKVERDILLRIEDGSDETGFLNALEDAKFYGVKVEGNVAVIPIDPNEMFLTNELSAERQKDCIAYIAEKYGTYPARKGLVLFGFNNHETLTPKDLKSTIVRAGKNIKTDALEDEYRKKLKQHAKNIMPQIETIKERFMGKPGGELSGDLPYDV